MTYEDANRCSKADVDRYLKRLREIKKNPDQTERDKAYEAIVKEWMERLEYRQEVCLLTVLYNPCTDTTVCL